LDLIAVGIEAELSLEAVRLLTIMLLKTGGCKAIQQTVYEYLRTEDTSLFFEYFKECIDNMKSSIQRESEIRRADSAQESVILGIASTPLVTNIPLPPQAMAFYLLQLMCEGEYADIKNYFRTQENNSRFVGLFESLSDIIDCLSRWDSPLSADMSILFFKTVHKLMLGPCKGNQEHFIVRTELIVSLNRFVRMARPSSYNFPNGINKLNALKTEIVKILLACIEGQPGNSVVFERVTTTVEFSIFNAMILPTEAAESMLLSLHEQQSLKSIGVDDRQNLLDFELLPFQVKYLVFIENLGL
jgi:hypothetical protein